MTDWGRPRGIVRIDRWLGWGWGHGRMVRPHWLARLIVQCWNRLSCHLYGHDWVSEIVWPAGADRPHASETEMFCPHCPARSRRAS